MMRTLAGWREIGSGMAREIPDQASETAESKRVGATPVTVPSTRSCDAATLNVHGCRTKVRQVEWLSLSIAWAGLRSWRRPSNRQAAWAAA
jgi:hypothetical protein